MTITGEAAMVKAPRRQLDQTKIAEFANRRKGATYFHASIAAQDRLAKLRDEFAQVPPSYRGYLVVGICSCLESHIKYSYGAAAERFFEYPELLRKLFKDVSVDIDTLIATTSKTFHLSDVVAASISVSTLAAYLERASNFFSVLMEKPHNFPWDYIKMAASGDADVKPENYPPRLARLARIFDARHKFVHETSIVGDGLGLLEGDDPNECVGDAMWLISQFQLQFEHVELSPKYSLVRYDEGLNDAVDRSEQEIRDAFADIKKFCDPVQYPSLEKLEAAFIAYLWARCEFYGSTLLMFRSEAAMSHFLDVVPEYRAFLAELGPKQQVALSLNPIEAQLAEIESEAGDDKSNNPMDETP